MFKINISDKGKTYKAETESEALVGKKIGDIFKGEDIDPNLKGYEIEITGTSDLSGIPGFKGLEGDHYHRKLLTRGPGMKNKTKGLRLRKTLRGEAISLKTHQVNSIVKKEGEKKFSELVKKEAAGEQTDNAQTSEAVETKPEAAKPEKAPATDNKETEKKEEPKQEPPAEEKK
jgi:small subunit ribosomal protein S6e